MRNDAASNHLLAGICVVTLVIASAACEKEREPEPVIAPPPDAPAPAEERTAVDKIMDKPTPGTEAYSMSRLDDDQKKVLDALAALGGKPIHTLAPTEARKQPTPAAAVRSVLKQAEKPVTPEEVGKVEDRQIASGAGTLPIRVYTPKEGKAPYPLILYFHGGGFVIASNDVYDSSARALANAAKAVVVAVDYRLAPEHKFPAAHDDAVAAYSWLLKNVKRVQGDAAHIAVVGESAGGNLAANVAIAARDKKLKPPVAVGLVYPLASSDLNSESYREHAQAQPLNKPMIPWFTTQYFRSPADAQDPRINLVAANLKGLPPVTIVNAEVDPLRSDGETLAKKLEQAGVDVKQKTYEGVAHEFFGQGAAVSDAKDAVEWLAGRLDDSFN